jgi:hypothetical protein
VQSEPRRAPTRHRSTLYPPRAQAIEHHFTSRATTAYSLAFALDPPTNIKYHNTVDSQPTNKPHQNITMTRINISYLIALGLLGNAVACKCSTSSQTTTITTKQW